MPAETPSADRLLRFARELQRATDYDGLVRTTQREIEEVTGYRSAWICVFEPDLRHVRVLSFIGAPEGLNWEHLARIPVVGDPMMEELVKGDHPVIVDDARIDPRTNKDLVAKLGNRTIINVPLATMDSPLGAIGIGTFGDEGPRPPTQAQLDLLMALASQVSVALTRIRWMDERERMNRERVAVQRRVLVAQKMESIGLLAGGIAHDLNNLLLMMAFRLHLVGRGPLTDDQRADVEGLTVTADHMAALVRQLLTLGRPQPETLEVVDLHARLRELVQLVGRGTPPGVTIELALGAPSAVCVGDPGQLDQVFMNLCVNATDAMPEGGRLLIETSAVELDEAHVETYPWAKLGHYTLVSVSDSGHGMTAEVLERIFEPFFTTKGAGRGTGLGLAVVYGIVRQHGGITLAYSEPGLGTTMKVLLPSYDASPGGPLRRTEGPPPLGSERILVAEDDPEVRSVVTRILEGAGYTVVTAPDGVEAAAAVAREDFDLVILDVIMPKQGGQDAFEQISALRPGLPVLFSTGYAPDLLPRGLGAGSSIEILHKPYDPDRLLRTVRRTLDGARR